MSTGENDGAARRDFERAIYERCDEEDRAMSGTGEDDGGYSASCEDHVSKCVACQSVERLVSRGFLLRGEGDELEAACFEAE